MAAPAVLATRRCGENAVVSRSLVTIDLGAVRHNARTLARLLGRSELWAVVKADGYGHGASDVARESDLVVRRRPEDEDASLRVRGA